MESCDTGVVRESIQQSHFVEGSNVREKANYMVEELRGELVADGTGVAGLAGILARCPAEVTEQGIPSFGIRRGPGSSDDSVDCGAGGRVRRGRRVSKHRCSDGVK